MLLSPHIKLSESWIENIIYIIFSHSMDRRRRRIQYCLVNAFEFPSIFYESTFCLNRMKHILSRWWNFHKFLKFNCRKKGGLAYQPKEVKRTREIRKIRLCIKYWVYFLLTLCEAGFFCSIKSELYVIQILNCKLKEAFGVYESFIEALMLFPSFFLYSRISNPL